jgi:hypothetical protein
LMVLLGLTFLLAHRDLEAVKKVITQQVSHFSNCLMHNLALAI